MKGHFKREIRATSRLAGPLAVAQLTTFMMGVVDIACIGRFSEAALGAVSVGNAMLWGVSSMAIGIPLALDPLISQAVGAGDKERAYSWYVKGSLLSILLSFPIMGLGLLGTSQLHLFGVTPDLIEGAYEYAIYRAPSLLFFQLFLTSKAYLQSHEVTSPIMVSALLANGVNLVFNILLIYGDQALEGAGLPPIGLPPLGIVGAGITTSISSIALAGFLWVRVQRIRPSQSDSAPPKSISMKKVLSVGWPISLQQIGESWLFCGFGVLAGRFGAVAVSAHQVALTLAASAFMLALGISSATSVRVGHAVGSKPQKSVRTPALSGVLLVLVVMGMTCATFLLIPHHLVRLLTDQPRVIEMAIPLLAFAATFALFDGIQAVMGGALRGAGDVRIPSLLSFLTYWGVGGSMGWIFMHTDYQIKGIWIGLCGGLMSASVVLSCRFFWLSRKPIVVLDDEEEQA